MNDDSHDNYVFVSSGPTIHTLMSLSAKPRGTDMIDEPLSRTQLTPLNILKNQCQSNMALRSKLLIWSDLHQRTESHGYTITPPCCLGKKCNKWFCTCPLKIMDYKAFLAALYRFNNKNKTQVSERKIPHAKHKHTNTYSC